MNFKQEVIAAKGEVGFERVLLEVANRLAERTDFTLTPRVAAQVIGTVLNDVEEARKVVNRKVPA